MMKKVRFEIQIPENDELMMKANEIIHRNSGWVEEDGEIPAPNIENDEYFGKLEYSVDLTRTDVVLSTVANTMNDVFSEVSEIIIDEIPKMTDSKNKSIIAFEIIVPDKAGNDAVGFCEVVRETLHKHFKGTSDYVDSNVIVWSNNGEDDEKDTIIESGATICLDSCIHKEEAFEKFTNAYFDVVGLPEYFGVVFGKCNVYEKTILEKLAKVVIDSDEDGEEQSTVDHVLADLETLRNRMNDLCTDRSIDARELINMLDDFITNYNN